VAEKFQAPATLGMLNTRNKGLRRPLGQLLRHFPFEDSVLAEATKATFNVARLESRKRPRRSKPGPFQNPAKHAQ